MAQTRDARSARIEYSRYNPKFALTRDMPEEDVFGLERLGINDPPGRHARRKARAKAKLEDQDPIILHQSTGALNQKDWRLPTVASFKSLSIPPLGGSTNAYQPAPSVASYRYPQDYVFDGAQGATRYQPGQCFAHIVGPSPMTCPPRAQTFQTVNAFSGPLNATSIIRKNSGTGSTTQKSPLSVVSYHGLPSLRVDKQYRSSKACLPPESAYDSSGRWPASSAPTVQQTPSQSIQTIHSKTAKFRPPVIHHPSTFVKDSLIHLPAPLPTPDYLGLARATPSLLSTPQRLLLILDLNGTLLYRSGHIQYFPRPCLNHFLSYALENHSVLIWSSATPKNVKGMCEMLFNPIQRHLLLGEWARDTLELTPDQYKERVQVYKRLDRIWANEALQHAHPGFEKGQRWGQHNTLLIDDSMTKACAQPYNHIGVPEFVHGAIEIKGGEESVLEQVVGYLEYARRWNNVSGFVKEMKFGVKEGWGWDWAKGAAQEPEGIVDDEDLDGGMKL